jgi:hypothetical protein
MSQDNSNKTASTEETDDLMKLLSKSDLEAEKQTHKDRNNNIKTV